MQTTKKWRTNKCLIWFDPNQKPASSTSQAIAVGVRMLLRPRCQIILWPTGSISWKKITTCKLSLWYPVAQWTGPSKRWIPIWEVWTIAPVVASAKTCHWRNRTQVCTKIGEAVAVKIRDRVATAEEPTNRLRQRPVKRRMIWSTYLTFPRSKSSSCTKQAISLSICLQQRALLAKRDRSRMVPKPSQSIEQPNIWKSLRIWLRNLSKSIRSEWKP